MSVCCVDEVMSEAAKDERRCGKRLHDEAWDYFIEKIAQDCSRATEEGGFLEPPLEELKAFWKKLGITPKL